MKRFLIFSAVCAFALTVFQSGGADVSVNFFYDNLNGGNWYQVADYGYVWQPDAATSADWRPYTDGYWAYTDVGWTWVSYEDFGWATYHYGRWVRLEDYGWCWVPGYEWGPAWVSWRTGGNYIGWAPLPPEGRGEVVYESRPITGHVDVEFGIGPAYYNFIDVRFIGEPVLRGHFYDYNQNVVYINNTVNVTNITYNNSVVYNYGPDYAVLSRYSTRPIQRLKLERTSLDPLQAVKAGNVTKVQGDKLVLAAPLKLQKGNAQIAPKVVKAKIDQPKIEKGWANISDPNTKAKLEQKFKTENSQNVPQPSIQPNAGANVNALASPGVSPFEKGKGKHKGEQLENQAAASVAPGTSPKSTAMPFEQGYGKKGKGHRVENEPGTSVTAGSSPVESFEQGKGKHKGQRVENEPGASAGSSPAESMEQGKGKKGRGQRFENEPGTSGGTTPAEASEQSKGKQKGHREQGEQTPGLGGPVTPKNPNANLQKQNNPEGGKHKGNRHQESVQPGPENVGAGPGGGGGKRREQIQSQGQPQGGQYGQQGGQQGGGKHREQIQSQGPPQGGQYGQQSGQQGGGQSKGKGKKGEASPSPSPR
ncbi:MAG: hypothetical protein DMF19_07510 [Verrucomicrobia bacterium]|nr:MAG: hypothetical protein DMF19_07510 [Verrucomicrobiota bacterium]